MVRPVPVIAPPVNCVAPVTVTVPIYALNQVSEERCEWLVPGLLKDKVLALVKSLAELHRGVVEPRSEGPRRLIAGPTEAPSEPIDSNEPEKS